MAQQGSGHVYGVPVEYVAEVSPITPGAGGTVEDALESHHMAGYPEDNKDAEARQHDGGSGVSEQHRYYHGGAAASMPHSGDGGERGEEAAYGAPHSAPPSLWSSGLCDCTDNCGNCCDTVWCTPCVLAQQYNMVAHNTRGIHWPFCCAITISDSLLTGGLASVAAALYLRQELRRRYGIESYVERSEWDAQMQSMTTVLRRDSSRDWWSDVCAALLCAPCVMCQNHREMTARGDWPGKCLCGDAPPPGFVQLV